MQSNREPSEEDTISLGVVGCTIARPRYGAAIGSVHQFRVTALADPNATYARAWSRAIGGEIAHFADLSALLASESPPEALVLDVPLCDRSDSILAAMSACRAVIAPPPFANTLEETDHLIDTARSKGVLLYAAFPRRFDPILTHAISLLNSGEIGTPQQIRCDWSFPPARSYGSELGADPDAWGWRTLLTYAMCHATDVCRTCFGDAHTVSADVDFEDADASQAVLDRTPLIANLVLGHENGPATCHFARSRAVTPFERYVFSGSMGRIELVVSSTNHMPAEFPALTIHRNGEKGERLPLPEDLEMVIHAPHYRMRRMLEDFAACAAGGEPASTEGAARASLEVAHGAIQSAVDRRKIILPMRRSPAWFASTGSA